MNEVFVALAMVIAKQELEINRLQIMLQETKAEAEKPFPDPQSLYDPVHPVEGVIDGA